MFEAGRWKDDEMEELLDLGFDRIRAHKKATKCECRGALVELSHQNGVEGSLPGPLEAGSEREDAFGAGNF